MDFRLRPEEEKLRNEFIAFYDHEMRDFIKNYYTENDIFSSDETGSFTLKWLGN